MNDKGEVNNGETWRPSLNVASPIEENLAVMRVRAGHRGEGGGRPVCLEQLSLEW